MTCVFAGSRGPFYYRIIGILLTDYYIICRGYLEIERLYDSRPDGPYWYTKGVNIRAVVAYFCGIAPVSHSGTEPGCQNI
jgi:NCS1 family nucleobase:cation symporter-1